ncbi:SDR family NAD(P)-dependent oxidoreductase [Halopseudomonas laoshanensis]|jgi:NAD(P)-dependent dehydrogenase (short-subunit alcohol dehydrogenase family)|uniref:SDR family NAD(P)-dependent oxidoreductase n=1 Tax=Halopseudomonas laoshanensis TaxID=2268758 RepID=A0A7V7KYA7_9GAMM|nr:SDR family oxidoreductase [Halopseudomonas laoshanensis]KAA0696582.1 SDR family NAD(P)-dependent oxidoreductase [Halopseudomonas laoshanensis]MBQ0744488.1 SDR family oxidoreductase [Pseudomonas sp.]MBQ0778898.1 SDR family oxidoreductase [Pseudomonas sp.]WOD09600.1 SDR family oxidoreductase [Pseudomonas sp. NyZ704]
MESENLPVALVTGAARGIGKGIAASLLRAGWSVVLTDVDEPAGQAAAEKLARLGTVEFIPMDVSDEASVMACIERIEGDFGQLDGLVNNAGMADPDNGPIEQLSLEAWNRKLGTNLTGAFLVAKHCIPMLRESGGAIVNIASTRAVQSEAHTEAYAASKGGLVALTHALAVSLGPTIRVNAVSPGWIDTRDNAQQQSDPLRAVDHQQHAVGRVGQPRDIGALVVFLLGPAAGFVTGQNLVADGGMTRQMIYVE